MPCNLASHPTPPPFHPPGPALLQAILSENNTLALEGSIVQLVNSSLCLDEHNWFKVVDGSFLLLNNSRINGTDFFTW